MTIVKIDRIALKDLYAYCFARREPAAVALWLFLVGQALADDDRIAAHHAIIKSAPLGESDVQCIVDAYDNEAEPDHSFVDWSLCDGSLPRWAMAAKMILRGRARSLLAHPGIAWITE